eukprot:Ihof_evm1s56 gene=Ihof_evmTU1s56
MTTAHRPTWAPAKGGGTARDLGRTQQYSSRDLPSEMTLKLRDPEDDIPRDFKSELRRREDEARNKRHKREELEEEEEDDIAPRLLDPETAALDADDPDNEEEDSDDSDDDDTAELLAELERIKKERAIEQQKKEEEENREQEQIRTESLMMGNPLLQGSDSFTVKRRWDDDVVFKNCARGAPDKSKPNYVNDTIRSDFHRKFMK